MKRYQIELLYLAAMLTITMVLFRWGTMYKTEYYGLDSNPVFRFMLWSMVIALLLFHRFVLKYSLVASLIFTLLIYFISMIIVGNGFWTIMAKLEKMDKQVTPLGWQFNYRWLQLFGISLLSVVLSEIVYGIRKFLNPQGFIKP